MNTCPKCGSGVRWWSAFVIEYECGSQETHKCLATPFRQGHNCALLQLATVTAERDKYKSLLEDEDVEHHRAQDWESLVAQRDAARAELDEAWGILAYVQSTLNQLIVSHAGESKSLEFSLRHCAARISRREIPAQPDRSEKHFIQFHGGPCNGEMRAYQERPPRLLKLPCESGGDIVYKFEFGHGTVYQYFYATAEKGAEGVLPRS